MFSQHSKTLYFILIFLTQYSQSHVAHGNPLDSTTHLNSQMPVVSNLVTQSVQDFYLGAVNGFLEEIWFGQHNDTPLQIVENNAMHLLDFFQTLELGFIQPLSKIYLHIQTISVQKEFLDNNIRLQIEEGMNNFDEYKFKFLYLLEKYSKIKDKITQLSESLEKKTLDNLPLLSIMNEDLKIEITALGLEFLEIYSQYFHLFPLKLDWSLAKSHAKILLFIDTLNQYYQLNLQEN